MTHNDFNHILGSINALSPDQMRQLRRELDSKLAATETTPASRRESVAAESPRTSEGNTAPAAKPIWEVAAEIRQSVPKEEWAKLPPDGAAQHDHYLYGTPKRPAR
jgi:hypothetical protein